MAQFPRIAFDYKEFRISVCKQFGLYCLFKSAGKFTQEKGQYTKERKMFIARPVLWHQTFDLFFLRIKKFSF